MVEIVAFRPEHVAAMVNHGIQADVIGQLAPRDLSDLAERGPAYTALRSGKVIGCGGLIEAHRLRATAWAMLAQTSPAGFIGVDRAVRHALATHCYARIEAYVDPRSATAMRWIAMLGFEMERSYVPYFFPDGSGASEWVLYPRANQVSEVQCR